MSEWISVEERLPDGFGAVLVAAFVPGFSKPFTLAVEFRPHDDPQWYRMHAEDEYQVFDDYFETSGATVTHWMSLPEPP